MLEAPKVQRRVLWVDDNPKNNTFLVQRLLDDGVRVDLAVSTRDGMARLTADDYDLVLTDMGRDEAGISKSTAGLELLQEARAKGFKGPILFFTRGSTARRFADDVIEMGGNGITSSVTELRGLIVRHLRNLGDG